MLGKVSLSDEIAQYRLINHRGMAVHDEPGSSELFDKRVRHDEVAQPQARKEQLAEAARQDDRAAAIQTLKRRNGPARVTVFAVVIVLKDQRPCAAGPL